MGSNWSQLRKSIERGDEKKSIEIYNKYSHIRQKLDPNAVINNFTLDTYMHISAKNGMANFLKILLYENQGNPNMMNRERQNVLHKCCEGFDDSMQYECVQLILKWHEKAKIRPDNTDLAPEININEEDIYENTPLHYASMRNLTTCVQSLVAHGAFLFVENINHLTPCDLAEQNGQKDIALFLESKMIFSKDDEENDMNLDSEIFVIEEKHKYGLKTQDLQEEKDKLLLEVADILQCNIFTAEIMLKKFSWSKDSLVESWFQDPLKCCEKCGISNQEIEKLSSSNNSRNVNNLQLQSLITKNLILNSTSMKNILGSEFLNSNIAKKLGDTYQDNKVKLSSSLSIQLNLDSITQITSSNSNLNVDTKLKSDLKKFKSDFDFSSTKNTEIDTKVNFFDKSSLSSNGDMDLVCQICFCDFSDTQEKINNEIKDSDEQLPSISYNQNDSVQIICGHKFCRQCWEKYLTLKIEEGNVSEIICPEVNCFTIIPNKVIGSLISKDTAQRFIHFDIRAFVDSNPNIKWCPFPGCGMAVKNPKIFSNKTIHKKIIIPDVHEQHNVVGDFATTVDCGQGHFFCWDCLQEGHEPATCENWKQWFEKIIEINPEDLSNTSEKKEQSANYLWLVTNSKKCPNNNCVAPIQKHEGCNHVKCYRCKFEFCWLCMEPWKKHSGSTGGYFQCNRYEATNKITQKTKYTISAAEEAHLKAVESNKFAHYYTRFKNHENSYKLEEPLLTKAKIKFETLIARGNDSTTQKINSSTESLSSNITKNQEAQNDSTIENHEDPNDSKQDDSTNPHSFIEEAIKELLKARKILRCSYVYGYYLDQFGHKKFIFEYIQTEFEESTENLSQIIARPHLKTSKLKIIRLTNILKRKRIDFLNTIRDGLNSFNDTPPALKKYSLQRWKYLLKDNIQHDEEFKNTIAVNLKELNPKNPWIIDKKGRHTNLLALLNDLPELEEELNSILLPAKEKNGFCNRWDCVNLRSINTLSGSICNYCSIKCMRIDRNNYLEKKAKLSPGTYITESKISGSLNVPASTSQKTTYPEDNSKNDRSSLNEFKKLKSSSLDIDIYPTSCHSLSSEFGENKESDIGNQAALNDDFDRCSENFQKETVDLNKKLMTGNSDNAELNNPSMNQSPSIPIPPVVDSNSSFSTLIPFDSLFLKKDGNDISYIIKNMENVLYDSNENKDIKTNKVCNFQIKLKK